MGAFTTCCRVFLVIVNIFFLILGLVFFCAGLFIRFGSSVYDSYIDSVKENLEKSATSSGTGTLDLSNFDLSEILFGIALGFIFFGLFLIIITVLGCCGSCYKIKFMILAYVIICTVLLAAQIVMVGILYGSPDTIHSNAKDKLKSSIKSDYMGLTGTNVVSMGWNVIMQQVKCCGVDDYNDFTGATGWRTTYSIYTIVTPLACCKTLPSSSDLSCATSSGATDSNNYKSTGCYGEIWDMSLGNTAIVAGALGGIGAFQLLLIIFGLVLLCSMKNNKTGPKA